MIDLVQLFNADLQRHKFDEYGRCKDCGCHRSDVEDGDLRDQLCNADREKFSNFEMSYRDYVLSKGEK